jgi:uncharacterized DUF497 family protein
MRIRWDNSKRDLVFGERGIDFADLNEVFESPYIEDRKCDDPEQFRVIGWAGGALVSFIVEYRSDLHGEFVWVVTAWKATKGERKAYEKAVK